MCLALSKRKTLLQDWTLVALNLVLEEEELTVTDRFGCLGSYSAEDGSVAVEVSKLISKGRAAYTRLKNLLFC